MSKLNEDLPRFPHPAFPSKFGFGMDLRDWFAGQALSAIITTSVENHSKAELFAQDAYYIADAMLRERAK